MHHLEVVAALVLLAWPEAHAEASCFFAVDNCGKDKIEPVCAPALSGHAVRCCGEHPDPDAHIHRDRSVCTEEVSQQAVDAGYYNPWEPIKQPIVSGHDGANATNALAYEECLARGLRLCFVGELLNPNRARNHCGSGCGHDSRMIWTESDCPCPEVNSPPPIARNPPPSPPPVPPIPSSETCDENPASPDYDSTCAPCVGSDCEFVSGLPPPSPSGFRYWVRDGCGPDKGERCVPGDSNYAVRCCGEHPDPDAHIHRDRSVCTEEVSQQAVDDGHYNPWEPIKQPLVSGHDGANATNMLAYEECLARGLRLCFVGELRNQDPARNHCGSGCGHNSRYVWTSSPCTPGVDGASFEQESEVVGSENELEDNSDPMDAASTTTTQGVEVTKEIWTPTVIGVAVGFPLAFLVIAVAVGMRYWRSLRGSKASPNFVAATA